MSTIHSSRHDLRSDLGQFIRHYLSRHRGIDVEGIAPDANLFEQGYVDSLGIFRMVIALENEFGIRLETKDLLDLRVASVHGLVELLTLKCESR